MLKAQRVRYVTITLDPNSKLPQFLVQKWGHKPQYDYQNMIFTGDLVSEESKVFYECVNALILHNNRDIAGFKRILNDFQSELVFTRYSDDFIKQQKYSIKADLNSLFVIESMELQEDAVFFDVTVQSEQQYAVYHLTPDQLQAKHNIQDKHQDVFEDIKSNLKVENGVECEVSDFLESVEFFHKAEIAIDDDGYVNVGVNMELDSGAWCSEVNVRILEPYNPGFVNWGYDESMYRAKFNKFKQPLNKYAKFVYPLTGVNVDIYAFIKDFKEFYAESKDSVLFESIGGFFKIIDGKLYDYTGGVRNARILCSLEDLDEARKSIR